MSIKYDEYDLLELFLDGPSYIADEPADGEMIYSINDEKGFTLSLFLSEFRNICEVNIYFNDLTVFSAEFKNVTSLGKKEDFLFINIDNVPRVRLKFKKQLGIELI